MPAEYPDWAAPYTPRLLDGRWVVEFPSLKDAQIGLRYMQGNPDRVNLTIERKPYHGWLVVEVTD